ncbi:MAG: hypothetical protein ACSLFQ_10130 [Thermoanaerobaculia bacterium]
MATTEADALTVELRDAVRELTAALGKFAEAIPDAETVLDVKELLQRHAVPVVRGPAEMHALRATVALFGALSVLGQELRPIGARIEAMLERVA